MNKNHFVRSTQVLQVEVLAVGERLLWRDCRGIFARIEELCGNGAADLFAEPVIKEQDNGRNLVVAWFCSEDADVSEIAALDRNMRARVEADLTARIEALRPAFGNPDLKEIVAAMLNVSDSGSIVAVGERAVLLNWAVLPSEARATSSDFSRHVDATIGRYLPRGVSPSVPGQSWTVEGGTATAPTMLIRGASASEVFAAPKVTTALSQSRRRGPGLLPAAALSGLFAALLAYIAWPQHLIYPEVIVPRAPPNLVNQDQVAKSLQERMTMLRTELAKPACEVNHALLGLPLGPLSGEAEAQQGGTTPAGGSTLPAGGSTTPAGGSKLVKLLDSSVVLVLATADDKLSSGSGFFVDPQTILTNRHVVAEASNTLFVVNPAIGRLPAKVIATTADSDFGHPDFALLRIEQPPPNVQPLTLSNRAERMENVIAGGFPDIIMSLDQTYQGIMNGETADINRLQLVMTQGNIMAMPTEGSGQIITHSASISPGNSGGPLIDTCGRVVGVNTFTMSDTQNVQKLNFALASGDALKFLSDHGVQTATSDAVCEPLAVSPTPLPTPGSGKASPPAVSGQHTGEAAVPSTDGTATPAAAPQ